MFKKIRAKLILLTVGSTLVSILFISVLTNITIFQRYSRYLEQEQARDHQEIVDLAVRSYQLNNSWDLDDTGYLDFSLLIHNYDIEIRDLAGNLVYSHKLDASMIALHNEMMKQMGHSMMNWYATEKTIEEGSYVHQAYELYSEGSRVGTIRIANISPYSITQRDVEFTKGINRSIAFATIISILVAILIGVYSSKVFSSPIIKITQAANDMRNGVLDIQLGLSDNTEELQELVSSINHLANSLQQQKILRSRLTADISHELRTPLTVLRSHIEAINDGLWEPTPDKLTTLGKEVNRLIKMVEELKYLEDIENHNLHLEIRELNLVSILNEVINSFRHEFFSKGIPLHFKYREDQMMFRGDEDKLKQVLINLLANALKYTNSSGSAWVRLYEDTGNIFISIKDSGIGIESGDLPYVFERFYRSDTSRNRKTGGTGIGLTIAKIIVEAHHGSIVAESQIGKGTEFTVILPKNRPIS